MPLGTRDILLVIRARNQMQGVMSEVSRGVFSLGDEGLNSAAKLAGIGGALTGIGLGFIGAGVAAEAFFKGAADDAIAYNQQAALTLTQVDQIGVSLDDVKNIARRVAKEIPAPFEQMQSSLYDIFSSMNVNTMQAETLLRTFSKGAVAGQVDLQDASRATIAIMNAFNIPVEQASHVMDVQFELVRKGVGTYAEFASVIGRVAPAAVASGQSIESMSGVMAFLTRNGLSAAMSANSAARAYELFSKPDNITNVEKLGVAVKDGAGNFRQLQDIVKDLAVNAGWAKMTDPQLKEAFENTFGKGTIQARRFFDVAIPNYKQLGELTGAMSDSSGALDNAYDIMFEQPQTQMQLLTNHWEVLKTEIGDKVIPQVMKLVDWGKKILDWWDQLDPATQDMIVKFGLVGAAIAIVVGVVLTIVGVFFLFAAAAAAVGIGLGAVAGIIVGVIGGVIVLGALIYAFLTNWNGFGDKVKEYWGYFQVGASVALDKLKEFWNWAQSTWATLWPQISAGAQVAWQSFQDVAQGVYDVHQRIFGGLGQSWGRIGKTVSEMWAGIQSGFNKAVDLLTPILKNLGALISDVFNTLSKWWDEHGQQILDKLRELGKTIADQVSPILKELGETVTAIGGYLADGLERVKAFSSFVATVAAPVIGFWMGFINALIIVIGGLWDLFGPSILNGLQIFWNTIVDVISSAVTIISNIIQLIMNVIQGDWSGAWENIKNIFGAVWDAIFAILKGAWDSIMNTVKAALMFVWIMIVDVWTRVKNFVSEKITELALAAYNKWNDIVNGVRNFALSIWITWSNLWESVKNFVTDKVRELALNTYNKFNEVVDFVRGIPGRVWDAIGDLGRLLFDAGQRIIQGLWDGIVDKWNGLKDFISGIGDWIKDHKGPASVDAKLLVRNGNLIMEGFSRGLDDGWASVQSQIAGYNTALDGSMNAALGAPGLGAVGSGTTQITVQAGAFQINIDNATENTAAIVQDAINKALQQAAHDISGDIEVIA